MLKIDGLNLGYKAANIFIKSQENLSSTRFIQDTVTNWCPKAVFSRSKEDFAEMSFLEFIESAIFYFALPILGENIYRNKLFSKLQPKKIQKTINEQIPKSVESILKNNNLSANLKNKAITSKAGILLACAAIPIAEYTLSFAKNLFTLKAFKKSNFNNIANLNKNSEQKEDKIQQQRVEESSKKQLKKAGIYSLLGLGCGLLLAKYGYKNEKLVNFSKNLIEPGKAFVSKFDIKNEKLREGIKSISLDFKDEKGKLALGKGQLGLTAILGLFGYSKAASDRGKLDVAEVWTRVPLVVFYTIFGSELFEKGFIKLLSKNNKFTDLIKKDSSGNLTVPLREEIASLAHNISKQKGIDEKECYESLIKQKAITTAIPYAFSIVFMGFLLSAITRLWTQYRYNHQDKNNI